MSGRRKEEEQEHKDAGIFSSSLRLSCSFPCSPAAAVIPVDDSESVRHTHSHTHGSSTGARAEDQRTISSPGLMARSACMKKIRKIQFERKGFLSFVSSHSLAPSSAPSFDFASQICIHTYSQIDDVHTH